MSFWFLGSFIFLVGMLSFLMSQKHYLSMLLSLELTMLSLYYLFCNFISLNGMGGELIFLFMTMMVCEGAFGLCLLIYYSRGYGCDENYFFFVN